MTGIDSEVVLVRLRLIAKYRNTLEEFRSINLDDYLSDFKQQIVVERLLQLMAEAAIDINKYLLVQLNNISPATSTDSFREVERQGIITSELAAELVKAVGMRNILVHQYKDIDNIIVFTAIQKALRQYPFYIQQITAYLDLLERDDG